MKIGLLSDTHSTLDQRILESFKDVDEIWHAGDVGNSKVIDQLEAFKPVVGVYGNIDNAEVRSHYPRLQRFEREGVSVVMTHIGGRPGRYDAKLLDDLKKNGFPKMVVCGHSHILLIKFDSQYKMLWVNPGAAGNYGIHQVKTVLRFELTKGEIKNMEVVEFKRE